MVEVQVVKAFRDVVEHVDRHAGDTFEATEERAEFIARKLPGYIEVTQTDYAALPIADLRRLAKERGITVPKGAGKADIAKLLEG